MNYKKLNDLVGWAMFLVAAFVYLSTIEPTASFWDCGEFIVTAYKLEVGHPPGAPFFMLVGRIFSAFVAPENAAMMINAMSALCSAFAILFLFWTTTAFARKLAEKEGGLTPGSILAVLGSGFIAAISFTFSDTFWFSAVEGEVYAMSAMFTAFVFWAIMKWERRADDPHNLRWLLLIAFAIGLSIGVHLLNILAIPAICMVYYFRKYEASWKGGLTAFAISAAIILFFQVIIIVQIFDTAGWFERIITNTFDLPFNIGAVIYFLVLFGAIAYGIYYTHQKGKVILNTILLAFLLILLGYSSFLTILIRSSADPPMDQNDPEDLISFVSYVKREQYGQRPILYGQYFNAPLDPQKPRMDGEPDYMKAHVVKKHGRRLKAFKNPHAASEFVKEKGGKKEGFTIDNHYIVKNDNKQSVYNYDPRFEVPFQRMYAKEHAKDYKKWTKSGKQWEGEPIRIPKRGGGHRTIERPDWFDHNLQFYFDYQLGWMYWRYFLWNFAGRQNDQQGTINNKLLAGNWISGIDLIDSERLGNKSKISPHYENHKAHNELYMLPLILGLIGFIYHFVRGPKDWTVILMLFLITGMAIVTYLNQPPVEPRERDYTNVGSFYAFAIWIGLGVYALFDAMKNLGAKDLQRIATRSLIPSLAILLLSRLGGSDHAFAYSLLYISVIGTALFGVAHIVGNLMRNRKGHALLAVLMTLPVPTLMAMEEWDDHDRSDRYTARDFAMNYLDSCEENAILFTNGDNDTFPLWYVQEVEEYRTDVRVVNLSLLNTDWYGHQLSRKAYESEALPFTLAKRKYRQGTRDVVYLRGKQNKADKYIDVDRAMAFVANDNNTLGRRDQYYIPSKKFSIDVPKQKVLNNGTVPKELADQVVDRIKWRIGRNHIMKNQMLVMSLLAGFDWERPIYFAVTTGPSAYLGLEDYFQLEGLAYRLVPIKTKESLNPNTHGRVHTDRMYKNLMNKFQWGGMASEEEIWMNNDNLRMTTNLRLQFGNLAEALIKEGKEDSAEKVIDKCVQVMPDSVVPYDRMMTTLMEKYFRIGAKDKAMDIGDRLVERYEKDLQYFASMEQRFQQSIKRRIRVAGFVLRRVWTLAKRHLDDKEKVRSLKEHWDRARKSTPRFFQRKAR